jgi:hypothetical protein
MAVWTRGQLTGQGGALTTGASIKGAFGAPSTYAQILTLLDELHTGTTLFERKIAIVSEIHGLGQHWLDEHKGTSTSDQRRRTAIETLLGQLATMDWKEIALTDMKAALTGYRWDDDSKSPAGIVFRSNDAFSKRLKTYLELTGVGYAKAILAPVVEKANEDKDIVLSADRPVTGPKIAFLEGTVDIFAARLVAVPIPADFAEGARVGCDAVLRGTDNPVAGYNSLVNYLVLRLINPALTLPANPPFGMVPLSTARSGNTKTLMVLSKMIQCAFNRSDIHGQGAELNPSVRKFVKPFVTHLTRSLYRDAGRGASSRMDALIPP